MQSGQIIFEALTLALIIFGALAIFMLRRRRRPGGSVPAGLFLRFTVFFFACALLVTALGVLLAPFGGLWLLPAGGLTLFLIARIGPRFLQRATGKTHGRA